MTVASNNLIIPQEQIDQFCARHHIRRLALFGSVLRADFGPDSDVDLHASQFLSRYFRDRVLAEADVQYEQ